MPHCLLLVIQKSSFHYPKENLRLGLTTLFYKVFFLKKKIKVLTNNFFFKKKKPKKFYQTNHISIYLEHYKLYHEPLFLLLFDKESGRLVWEWHLAFRWFRIVARFN
jgi:hypothetical protein